MGESGGADELTGEEERDGDGPISRGHRAAVHGGFGGGSQRTQQWKWRRGEGGKCGGDGARARGFAHFLSEHEGEERRS